MKVSMFPFPTGHICLHLKTRNSSLRAGEGCTTEMCFFVTTLLLSYCSSEWSGTKGFYCGGWSIKEREELLQPHTGIELRQKHTHLRTADVWTLLIMTSETTETAVKTEVADGGPAAGKGGCKVRGFKGLPLWAVVFDRGWSLSCVWCSGLWVIPTFTERMWERSGRSVKRKASGTEVISRHAPNAHRNFLQQRLSNHVKNC